MIPYSWYYPWTLIFPLLLLLPLAIPFIPTGVT